MLAFLLSLALAQAPLTGIVRDSSGAAVPGATVTIRSDSGPVSDGHRSGRPVHLRPCSGWPGHAGRPRWRFRAEGAAARAGHDGNRAVAGIIVRGSHGDAEPHRATARRYAGQRHGARQQTNRAVGGRRRRRPAAAGADVFPVPPHEQHGGAPDRARRLASRHRSQRRQPHARPDRRRAVQRSLRRMGVLDARAARRGRPDRDGRRVDVEPLRQLRDGRRHQHRDQPARAPHRRARARSTGTAAARSSTSSAATSGGTSGSRSKAASSTPMGICRSPSRNAVRSTPT